MQDVILSLTPRLDGKEMGNMDKGKGNQAGSPPPSLDPKV